MKTKIYYLLPILALLLGVCMHVYMDKSANFDAKTLAGDKVYWHNDESQWTVVNFFAQWCAPCLREIPQLNGFAQAMDADTRLFMVSYDVMSNEALSQIARKYNIDVPLIVNNSDTVLPIPMPKALPATYVLSPQGELAETFYGEVHVEQLQDLVNKARLKGL